MMLDSTPKKSPGTAHTTLQEPADVQQYNRSAQKRRRLSFGQSPVTPAKADAGPSNAPEQRPESPTLDLCDEADGLQSFELDLHPNTENKVLKQELKLIKQELHSIKRANEQAAKEKEQIDKEVLELRQKVAQLTGANIENCNGDELHRLGKALTQAQGRLTLERTRQTASKLRRHLS